MTLRALHRMSAILLVAFACLHIANHLAAVLGGVSSHIAFMDAVRPLYRHRAVEAVLLACAGFQVGSGLWFVVRGWKKRQGLLPWLQALSGAYIAFFLVVHVSAVLFGRLALGLDTNFYYAAAGFHVPPNQYFFAPYYFFGVFALFTHLGCAAYWRLQSKPHAARRVAVVLLAAGGVVSLCIVLALAGVLRPVDIPAKYKATYLGKAFPDPSNYSPDNRRS